MSHSIPLSRSTATRRRAYIHDAEHYLGRIASILTHTAFVILVIRFFILEPGITDGTSMLPTIRDNTSFIVEKISPIVVPPQRFDIVQHIEPIEREKILVKRIIGLPGETITI
ncbi:MAG: signal peptidase I, partial [Patescibacteria group bacterium]